MASINEYLDGLLVGCQRIKNALAQSELAYDGPDSDADCSRLAVIWETLRCADADIWDCAVTTAEDDLHDEI